MKKDPVKKEKITDLIIEGIQDKKGFDITILDLSHINGSVAETFIICSGNSDTHVDAIADSVEDYVNKNLKEKVWHKEGKENKEWILLDYVNVVVHIFQKDKRPFFALEELWGDAKAAHID